MASRSTTRKVNRRVGGGSPRNHRLDVQIRVSTARRQRNEKLGRWIWNCLIFVALAVGSVFGIRYALDRFFYHNADYNLSRITLNLDNILTRDEALAETGLKEGVNIFSVDLNKVEATLRENQQVKDVQIERELPDHLTITLTGRTPVAWIADGADTVLSEKCLLVDDDGYVMKVRHIQPEYYHLPAIYGVKSDNLADGTSLESEDLRLALQLLRTVDQHPECLLHIRSMDISKGYCIEVVNDSNSHITFAATDFEEQLGRLQKLLAHCNETGRTLETVNLMVKRNTPVTFVAAAAPAAEAEPAKTLSPTSTSHRTRRN